MSEILTRQLFKVLTCFLAPLCLALTPLQVTWANTGSVYSVGVKIHGTVVANGACTFNNGGAVTIDFQEVELKASENNTLVLNDDYIQPLKSEYTCTGDTAGKLQMKLVSTSGSYETYNGFQVLATDKGIVSIELLIDGAEQNMGEWFTVEQNNPPKLEVQLVQISTTNSNNVATGDTFTASATLVMAFN